MTSQPPDDRGPQPTQAAGKRAQPTAQSPVPSWPPAPPVDPQRLRAQAPPPQQGPPPPPPGHQWPPQYQTQQPPYPGVAPQQPLQQTPPPQQPWQQGPPPQQPWQQGPAPQQPWQQGPPPAAYPPYAPGSPAGPPARRTESPVPSNAVAERPADTAKADRVLIAGGGACIAVSVLSIVLRMAGVLPSGLTTVLVVMVMAIGLRIFVRYAAKSASSAHRARVTKTVALSGLGISVFTVFTSLHVLLRHGSSNDFVADVFAHLWTIAILLAVVGTARTLNWQALLGMGLTGFLAVSGLTYALARPIVKSMGPNSIFANVIFAPFLEELLKVVPALLILIFAARRKQARPSALEMALLGAVIGAGFALYENTQFHRGGFHLGAMPILSLVNPTASSDGSSIRVTYFAAGHMIYTMLTVFGIAVGLLYRHRFWWAKFAIPVSFAVAFGEHATQNYATFIAVHNGNIAIFNLLRVLTLWGWSSSLLIIAGIVVIGREERRVTNNGMALKDTVPSSFWLKPATAQYAATALARMQLSGAPTQRVKAAR